MVITARRAADSCREWYFAFRNKGKGEEKCVLELLDAADTIKALEAALPKWISVEDRVPDDHGNFLTKIHCDNGDWIEVNTFYYTEKEWWHDSGKRTEEATEFVTHWMPLPEQTKDDA